MTLTAPLVRQEHIPLTITTRTDYAPAFLRDRFIVEARTPDRNGYSAMMTEIDSQQDFLDHIEDFGFKMRRCAIDTALELGYEAELARQAATIQRLGKENCLLRRPWYINVRDKVTSWVEGLK